jgi:hypothetical protein
MHLGKAGGRRRKERWGVPGGDQGREREGEQREIAGRAVVWRCDDAWMQQARWQQVAGSSYAVAVMLESGGWAAKELNGARRFVEMERTGAD